jgi:hypothetical protein
MKEVWTMINQYQNNLCEKLEATNQDPFTHRVPDIRQWLMNLFRRLHAPEFLSKVKALQIRFSENMISTNRAYTQNSILRKAAMNTYNWSQGVEPKWFQNLEEEQATQYSQKTASSLKETREQASNVSKEQQEP